MMITSFSNQSIKAIRKLAERKERQATNLFFIEGLRIVAEAVQTHARIHTLVWAPELLTSEFGQGIQKECEIKGIPHLEVSKDIFAALSHKDGPQGIAAIVQQDWQTLESISPMRGQLWVALESVQNPGNLGTIMRTAEAIGAAGILLLDHCTDPHDPTAVKASMGAIFSLKLVSTEYQEFKDWCSHHKIQVVGSSDKAATDCFFAEYQDPCILLMGSEREGLPEKYVNLCDDVVRIPMQGRSDSLNLSIATAIILYQIYNHRRK